jgi:hypothetical protein
LQRERDRWLDYFVACGHAGAERLADGMEGVVYRLGDGSVAKAWTRKSHAELLRLQAFYEGVADAHLPFAAPRFTGLREVDGACVTIEPEIAGTPLERFCDPARELPAAAVDCFLTVLESLAAVPDDVRLRALAAIDEPRALWDGHETWPAALLALLERRVAAFGDQLRAAVPQFDVGWSRLRELVRRLPGDALGIVHGDLIPANVLVDEALRPLAVLDFGFLSTAGDPAFDAAIAASIFDMYGPNARAVEAQLDVAIAQRFGYARDRITLYRAAYAIATSNAYDPRGADGHFRWCAELLQRAEVRDVLGMGRDPDAAPAAPAR